MITPTSPIMEVISETLDLLEHTLEGDGGTYDVTTLEPIEFHTGYMVATKQGASQFKLGHFDTLDVAMTLGKLTVQVQLTASSSWYLGTWVDNGILYVEASQWIEERSTAFRTAHQQEQLSIFNCKTGQVEFL